MRDGKGIEAPAMKDRTSGSVLILTLWTLVFLAALSISVAAYVSAGVELARHVSLSSRARDLARGGVEHALAVVSSFTNDWESPAEPWSNAVWAVTFTEDGSETFSVSNLVEVTVRGERRWNAGIADEQGKIHLNRADPELLSALLRHPRVGVDPPRAARLSEWASRRRAEGSTTNGICSLEEWRTKAEADGLKLSDREFAALRPFATVFGDGHVNVHRANPLVLYCLAEARRAFGAAGPADGEAAVESIVKRREETPERGLNFDPATLDSELARKVLAALRAEPRVVSSNFSGVAFGRIGTPDGRASERRVAFVIDRQGRKRYWHEE